MAWFVLVAWLIQASVGAWMLVGWARRGRLSRAAITHVALVVPTLGLWIVFLATGALLPAWLVFAMLTVGLGFGDVMLIRRTRRLTGITSGFWKDYGSAVGTVFRGRLTGPVTFHALFSPVVYFSCLGVCIGASVAASGSG